jgi:hypothetical protein
MVLVQQFNLLNQVTQALTDLVMQVDQVVVVHLQTEEVKVAAVVVLVLLDKQEHQVELTVVLVKLILLQMEQVQFITLVVVALEDQSLIQVPQVMVVKVVLDKVYHTALLEQILQVMDKQIEVVEQVHLEVQDLQVVQLVVKE